MEDKEKEMHTWKEAFDFVSELIAESNKQAKKWFIMWIITFIGLVATNGYWIYVFSCYDMVTQDGDINSVNHGEQGDMNNGAESQN